MNEEEFQQFLKEIDDKKHIMMKLVVKTYFVHKTPIRLDDSLIEFKTEQHKKELKEEEEKMRRLEEEKKKSEETEERRKSEQEQYRIKKKEKEEEMKLIGKLVKISNFDSIFEYLGKFEVQDIEYDYSGYQDPVFYYYQVFRKGEEEISDKNFVFPKGFFKNVPSNFLFKIDLCPLLYKPVDPYSLKQNNFSITLVDESLLFNKSFPISNLPNLVFPIIFSNLRLIELLQISQVCKKWKSLVDSDYHWLLFYFFFV